MPRFRDCLSQAWKPFPLSTHICVKTVKNRVYPHAGKVFRPPQCKSCFSISRFKCPRLWFLVLLTSHVSGYLCSSCTCRDGNDRISRGKDTLHFSYPVQCSSLCMHWQRTCQFLPVVGVNFGCCIQTLARFHLD